VRCVGSKSSFGLKCWPLIGRICLEPIFADEGIGLSRATKRVISVNALKSKRTARASQDGSREFITLIASICADGSVLTPALIYQGASHDLQDTWLDNFDPVKDHAFFASSENGWSCDLLGQNWLENVFDRLL
jgi:hypothetical protein